MKLTLQSDLADPDTTPKAVAARAPASPQFIKLYDDSRADHGAAVAAEISAGLCNTLAQVSPKFFYDPLGSSLFEAITALDEYYPTRTEAAIFDASYSEIATAIKASGVHHPCLIDLGAGNCQKASALMPHLLPRQYVPVDISVEFLRNAATQVQMSHPALDIVGLGMDFSNGLTIPPEVQTSERVFFYPGSSIGNFHTKQALAFLQQLSDPAQGRAAGLLLGIDLVKSAATLEAAYDDALGVTAAFNKNLLRHLNSLIGADFDVRQWRHVALFNHERSRIEMHLEARCNLTVSWPGHQRQFNSGERIHTECSYKYTLDGMTALLHQAGFSQVQHWTDPKQWFAVFWAAV